MYNLCITLGKNVNIFNCSCYFCACQHYRLIGLWWSHRVKNRFESRCFSDYQINYVVVRCYSWTLHKCSILKCNDHVCIKYSIYFRTIISFYNLQCKLLLSWTNITGLWSVTDRTKSNLWLLLKLFFQCQVEVFFSYCILKFRFALTWKNTLLLHTS